MVSMFHKCIYSWMHTLTSILKTPEQPCQQHYGQLAWAWERRRETKRFGGEEKGVRGGEGESSTFPPWTIKGEWAQ